MKSRHLAACLLAGVLSFAVLAPAQARNNPSVQPVFFQTLEQYVPASAPPPVAVRGAVTEVTWEGLAWELAEARRTGTKLVIEIYSADQALCAKWNPLGPSECVQQLPYFEQVAAQYSGRVRFVRFDASRKPLVLYMGARVLPSHIFVSSYTDPHTYEASRIWGLLDDVALLQAIADAMGVKP